MEKIFTGCIQERDPFPFVSNDGFFQSLQSPDLELVILFPGAWMIRFVLQQLAAGRQLVPTHLGNELYLSAALAEGGGLVKRQIVHRHNFGRGAERNAVPP